MRDGVNEYTLLCEGCGYVIEGLPRGGECPECGRAIAESLPERRDRIPGVRECLLHPVRCFDRLTITHDRAALRIRRCSLSGFASVLTGVLALIADQVVVSGVRFEDLIPAFALIIPATLVLCPVGFEGLSLLESKGLRVIGRARGYRMTSALSQSITAAASSWWIVSSIGIGTLVSLTCGYFVYDLPPSRYSPDFWSLGRSVALVVGIALVAMGFLMFETMAYAGLRRCKFANRTKPDAESEPDHPCD